jgi:putative CocE/NonD family hydrolase
MWIMALSFFIFDLLTVFLWIGGIGAFLLLLLFFAYWNDLHTRFYLWALHFPKKKYSVRVLRNQAAVMQDGIKLYADVYTPKKTGAYPTVVIRTVYSKSNPEHKYPFLAKLFASQGFSVVVQDVRGKYLSEGEFTPFVREEQDGLETLSWALKQKWCDGRVCFYGFSYLATCCWLVAANNPKGLKAIVPMFSSQDVYAAWVDSGVPFLKDILFWLAKHHPREAGALTHEEIDEIVYRLPTLQFDKRLREGVDTFKLWITHLQQDASYWMSISVHQRRESIRVPILFVGGWFDRFINNMVEEFITTVFEDPKNEEVKKSALLIGPWCHNPADNYIDMPFPTSASYHLQLSTFYRWIKKMMEGEEDPVWKRYPVRFFLLGKNRWCQAEKWPHPASREKNYFLHVNSQGKGVLEEKPQKQSIPLHFIYDPDNPFPSIGGKMVYGNRREGPREITKYLDRPDVVTWSTAPLEKSLLLCGPSNLTLHVSSSAKDTDFYVKLCVTKKLGKTYHLADGFVRMRYLDSVKATQGIQPGQIYRIELSLGHMAYAFSKGDRVTLLLTSSDFPNHGRNLNTGGSNEGDSEEVKAYQKVVQGGVYRSELVLTTIEEKDLIFYE